MQKANAFVELFDLEPYQDGDLRNLTFAVKDCIDIKDKHTGCGNPTWQKTHPPAVVNAICVEQLLNQGATCIGKTITDEITFSLEGENAHFGTPLNPKAPERVPGGSSSGSASAVACGLVDFALGTDTGGSIRVPASNCGIYGMRPSFGMISSAGVMHFAPSIDTVGIHAKSYEILEKVASTMLSVETAFEPEVGNIYLVKEAFALSTKEICEAFEKHLAKLQELFPGKVREVSLHMVVEEFSPIPLHHWLETFTTIETAEIWSTHGPWVEKFNPDFGERIKANFEYAKGIDRTKIGEAIEHREWYFNLMSDFLKPNDVLCFPTTPLLAPIKGSLGNDHQEDEYYSKTLSVCSIAGLCRLPQISLPLAEVSNVPIGLSLAAAHRNDAFLLGVAGKIDTELRSLND
jgi:amidase